MTLTKRMFTVLWLMLALALIGQAPFAAVAPAQPPLLVDSADGEVTGEDPPTDTGADAQRHAATGHQRHAAGGHCPVMRVSVGFSGIACAVPGATGPPATLA